MTTTPNQTSSFADRARKGSSNGFVHNFRTSKADLVYLVKGKDRGYPAWHYVLVEKMKLPLFLKQIESGTCNVAEFGKILYSGWGDEPSEEIIDKIKAEYGG